MQRRIEMFGAFNRARIDSKASAESLVPATFSLIEHRDMLWPRKASRICVLVALCRSSRFSA